MPLETAVEAIQSRALSLWPDIEAAVPLAWPNDSDFVRPVDVGGNALPWVLIETSWIDGDYASVGAPEDNIVRRLGNIWVHAFVGRGTGIDRARELMEEAAGMFEGADFDGVVCDVLDPAGDADSEDGNYAGLSAAVSFDYDETA